MDPLGAAALVAAGLEPTTPGVADAARRFRELEVEHAVRRASDAHVPFVSAFRRVDAQTETARGVADPQLRSRHAEVALQLREEARVGKRREIEASPERGAGVGIALE